jgi:hypothetical protein
MRTETIWSGDAVRMHGYVRDIRGGRAAAARREARLCLCCGERRALFVFRGLVRADRDHNLCFECYRAEVNRLRARRLVAAGAGAAIANPRPQPSKAVSDRAALLADLAARRRHAQIMARHALDAPVPEPAADRLAS